MAGIVQARNNSFQNSLGNYFKTWASRERNMRLHYRVSGHNGRRKGGTLTHFILGNLLKVSLEKMCSMLIPVYLIISEEK